MKKTKEHWRWMEKNIKEPKVVYKGNEEMIEEIENLEDTIVEKNKEILALKQQIEELRYPFMRYGDEINSQLRSYTSGNWTVESSQQMTIPMPTMPRRS